MSSSPTAFASVVRLAAVVVGLPSFLPTSAAFATVATAPAANLAATVTLSTNRLHVAVEISALRFDMARLVAPIAYDNTTFPLSLAFGTPFLWHLLVWYSNFRFGRGPW